MLRRRKTGLEAAPNLPEREIITRSIPGIQDPVRLKKDLMRLIWKINIKSRRDVVLLLINTVDYNSLTSSSREERCH
jgi:hypothetical protein